jgi:uncharacterized protein YndB with AHSA1/START domain
MLRSIALVLLAALVSALPTPACAIESRVSVARDGELVIIDAVLIAPVPPAEAWAVLTDFDAMARFVPDLDDSRVTVRAGNRLRLEQRGVVRWGPFARPYTLLRDVELAPNELVQSRGVGGTIRRVRTQTRLAAVAGGTEVRHHLEFVLDVWLPDFVAEAFLRHEVNQQFEAIVEEMLRRQQRVPR